MPEHVPLPSQSEGTAKVSTVHNSADTHCPSTLGVAAVAHRAKMILKVNASATE